MTNQFSAADAHVVADQLDAAILPLRILSHPVYNMWENGVLPKDVISMYTRQYNDFVDAFPQFVSTIFSLCPSASGRQLLLEHLNEEEGQSATKANHPTLWQWFSEGLGNSLEALQAERPLANTKALVDLFFAKCRESYAAGLGILYAYESQVPEVAEFKMKALKAFYDVNDARSLAFFEVHAEADVHHRREVAGLIAELSPEDQAVAQAAAVEGARALWQFLDGIAEAANIDISCATVQ
jgi:pyrroloquinoline-quinone synthase